MKFRGVMIIGMMLVASTALAAGVTELKSKKDKASYAIGMDMGNSLKRNEIDVDPDILAQALKAVLTGQKTLLTKDDVKTILTDLQQEVRTEQLEKRKKEGEAFLAANKKKEGVKTLPSGLQYKVITEGKGEKPALTDTVTVNYKGTMVDGTEFDSSYKRGKPATFPVNGVIKGWTEALQLMKVGSKWDLYIPSDLAYGEQGRPGMPPNSTLIFEVELLSIDKKK